jgi:hypothetical protein
VLVTQLRVAVLHESIAVPTFMASHSNIFGWFDAMRFSDPVITSSYTVLVSNESAVQASFFGSAPFATI